MATKGQYYSDFDMTTLTDLPDLAEIDEVPLDILAGKLTKLQTSVPVPVWKFVKMYLGIFWISGDSPVNTRPGDLSTLVESKDKLFKLKQLMRVMVSRKFNKVGMDQTTDHLDVENVMGL